VKRLIIISIFVVISGCSPRIEDRTIPHQVLDWQARETSNISYQNNEPDPAKIIETGISTLRSFRLISDAEKWGVDGYWQTAEETEKDMSGDCEDFAILIYITLLRSGINYDYLGIIVLDVNSGGTTSRHAVLGIFPDKNIHNFYILDYWLLSHISEMPNAVPVYGCTLDSFWWY
jgi:predicted transglutaminase-like cysteine proteinase